MQQSPGDWTHNVPKEEFPAIQAIYRLYGKPDEVEVVQRDAKHNFNQESREAVYRLFAKHVLKQSNADSITEAPIKAHKLQEMMATSARPLPANALTFEGIFEAWRQRGQDALKHTSSADRRRALGLVLGTEWPAQVMSEVKGQEITPSRPGAGDRVSGILVSGSGPAAIIVDPAGAPVALRGETARALIAAHRPVLLLNVFQTASAVAPRDRSGSYFLTYNVSDDQARVQDIATAISYLEQNSKQIEIPDVYGDQRGELWSMLAAAVSPYPVKLHTEAKELEGSNSDSFLSLAIPGLQRAGGLVGVRQLLDTTTSKQD